MTAEVVTCLPGASVADVVVLMDANRVRHIPVAEDGRAVGIISMRDIVSVRLTQLELDIEVLREQLITGAR
jgi:CBS domain-containing protein